MMAVLSPKIRGSLLHWNSQLMQLDIAKSNRLGLRIDYYYEMSFSSICLSFKNDSYVKCQQDMCPLLPLFRMMHATVWCKYFIKNQRDSCLLLLTHSLFLVLFFYSFSPFFLIKKNTAQLIAETNNRDSLLPQLAN